MVIDAAELRRAIEVHGRTVFSIALRITGDHGIAEEVAQDVFLELHRSGERLEGEDHVRYWLRRVATHRSTDAIRRRSHRPESGADEWMEEQHGGMFGTPGKGGLNNGLAHRLESTVSSLPEAMRAVVVLRYGEEMTPEEISRLLGQPLPTVKSNLQRGLKILRQKAAVTMKEYLR